MEWFTVNPQTIRKDRHVIFIEHYGWYFPARTWTHPETLTAEFVPIGTVITDPDGKMYMVVDVTTDNPKGVIDMGTFIHL